VEGFWPPLNSGLVTLLSRTGQFSAEYRRNWLLHSQRMPQTKPLKSYHYRPQGRRTIGRPKKRWREQLQLRRRNCSKGPILDIYDNDDCGNSLSSLFNHGQQQIFCSVHGSKIVNHHNAVAEDIPFIWKKTERELT